MFSDTFLLKEASSSQSQEQARPPKSPVKSFEDWQLLEGVSEWPCTAPGEAPGHIDQDTVLGSLDEISQNLETHAPWGGVFLDRVEKRLEEMERALGGLADHFLWIPTTAPDSENGEPSTMTDTTFLTELRDSSQLSRRSPSKATDTASLETLTLDTVVYPGVGEGSRAVPFPGTLAPLPLLHLATKTTPLPPYIKIFWQKLFHSDDSCSLLQNTFWYVWLSYFKSKPDPKDQSRLLSLISENFMSLHHSSLGQKHKDEVFIHLPGCLARAVYSAFCHMFPKSSKVFNSDEFLSYLTNLTSEWITGVAGRLGSWKSWPRHLLDPHFTSESEDTGPKQQQPPSLKSTFSEKDVMRLSIKDKPRSVRLSTQSAALQRSQRTRSSHTAQSRAKTPTINVINEEVGVGEGPRFECVQFGLTARSPLLQNYLFTHGLEERGEGGTVGPVVGRTQISKPPPSSVSYKELLRNYREESKRNYDQFEKALARSEQEINTARKKHNALLRASDRRTETLLQHKYEVAIMAEKIMNKYASKTTPIKLAQTTEKPVTEQ